MARIEQSMEVNAPARTVYDQLTRFEHYPRFMDGVVEVRQLDDTHLRWHSRAGNLDREWDAEITEQVPERGIAWRHNNMPHYAGRIDLQAISPERTRIAVSVDCEHGEQLLAQHGDAERAVAELAEQGLARFKKFIEGRQRESGAAQRQPGQQQMRQEPQDAQKEAHKETHEQPRGGAEARSWMPNLMQMWGEPLSLMRKMSEEMDQLVGKLMVRPAQLLGAAQPSGAPPGAWSPAVEVARSADKVVICAELPGVRRDDVRVEIKKDSVTIEGERPPGQQARELQRTERSYGHFYRVIALPEGAEPDSASAALCDGVLEITVSVPEQGRPPRRIDIRPQ